MAWRHPSRRWRAALVAALLTFGAYAPEAKSDSIEVDDYEILILRVADAPDALPGEPELCRWWYLRSSYDVLTLSPIVPKGWTSALGCNAVMILLNLEETP